MGQDSRATTIKDLQATTIEMLSPPGAVQALSDSDMEANQAGGKVTARGKTKAKAKGKAKGKAAAAQAPPAAVEIESPSAKEGKSNTAKKSMMVSLAKLASHGVTKSPEKPAAIASPGKAAKTLLLKRPAAADVAVWRRPAGAPDTDPGGAPAAASPAKVAPAPASAASAAPAVCHYDLVWYWSRKSVAVRNMSTGKQICSVASGKKRRQ